MLAIGCSFLLVELDAASAVETNSPKLAGSRPEITAANYATLQAAIDALPAEGGLVRLPAGVFELQRPLQIRSSDVCLVGAGTATLLVNVNQAGEPAIAISHPDSTAAGADRSHELWRIRLADLRILGNPASGTGIHAHGINELFLDGVTVSEHGKAGILLDHCYEDARVVNCLITYNKGVGLDLQGCHDIVVAANQFEENQDALHCFDGFNLCMTGNCLDDHLGRGVVIENTYGSVLSGNMIEECASAAVVLDRDCYGIAISANVIAHNGAGIELRDAHGCTVSANALTIMKQAAIRVHPSSGRIAISANSFSNSYIGDGVRRSDTDLEAAGMVIDGGQDIGVTGNVFSGVRPKALELTGNENRGVLFGDNLLVDSTADQEPADSKFTGNLERP
jgi:hypothetical protein